ncbi:MAG: hypothetical protein IKI58_08485 [Oscillospiraceae bacterium]|nr:hypothetical protein [Oscillospiraceae bacterium]
MTGNDLENFYREHLEEDIVLCLSERRNIPPEDAMRLYYHSRLADRIHEGEYGIQYLDYSVLTDILEQELRMNMETNEAKELKEIDDFIKAFLKLEAQKCNPTRDGMIQALSEAQNVASTEIISVEHQQGDVIPMLWSEFSNQDLYRKLLQYQEGLYNHAVKKYGEELIKRILSEYN